MPFRMRGNKTKALCCIPLGPAVLLISVYMILGTLGNALQLGRNTWDEHDDLKAADYVAIAFNMAPALCALLAPVGVLLKSSKLLQLGVYVCYPTILAVLGSLVALWVGVYQHAHDASKDNNPKQIINDIREDVTLSRAVYVVAAISTLFQILQLALICYVADIYKSSAKTVARGKSLWKIEL